ncbi:MAG: peptidoglycan bridge formation glycyltransferase FemA/FemB family protein [Candidatus Gracilibacteria bacterium]|jgi:lipid II:glycine glycyltransferase (peptidoglycan interpeptide bridge formation enzyme)
MLIFSEISADELDNFSKKNPLGNIHQTGMWARFQEAVPGRGKVIICGVKDGGILAACGLFVRQKLPMGMCWYFCPRGPMVNSREELDCMIEGLKSLLKKEKCVFLRIEPEVSVGSLGRNAHAHYFPESTVIVDLSGSEEEILRQMKPKGRYNIKVAKSNGVVVKESKDVKAFHRLFVETTGRDGFSGHPVSYYEAMLERLGDNSKLYLAELDGEVIAGIIVSFYEDVAIYYFGASSNKHRNMMAPYLLQWTAMLEAKVRGCKSYDLFGIAPDGAKNHPWQGITDFKLKFGGMRVNYPEAREVAMKRFWYWGMRIAKKLARR